jgi:hypothetical protein
MTLNERKSTIERRHENQFAAAELASLDAAPQ